ncbi:MAG: SPOR domain-containing protein [Microscillaceae bacterium]|nr:SPOR domain-containing protein [Microscillaceae bacterium]MDW8461100.1 SPOR domain-containing protein [Cytophagales bacterium]
MKKAVLLGLVFMLIATLPLVAQKMTRKERKEARKRGRELKKEFEAKFKTPEHLQEYKQEVKTLQQSTDSLLKVSQEQKQREEERQREAERIKAEAEARREEFRNMQNTIMEARRKGIPPRGTYYSVQVGSEGYKKLQDNAESFNLSDSNARQSAGLYLLGMFKTKEEADELKKQITKMGIQESWIVTYQDGKEVANERNMATQNTNSITTK